jgi:very-short-patch-repair endonuclease
MSAIGCPLIGEPVSIMGARERAQPPQTPPSKGGAFKTTPPPFEGGGWGWLCGSLPSSKGGAFLFYICSMSLFKNVEQKDFRRSLRNEPTYAERALWYSLRKNGVGAKFRRQESVGPFILDFYCPELRLAVEVDGASHAGREDYDRRRDSFLHEFQITILRFTDSEVLDMSDRTVQTIRAKVEELRQAGVRFRRPST